MIDLHCHFLPGIDGGPLLWLKRWIGVRCGADGIQLSVLTAPCLPSAGQLPS